MIALTCNSSKQLNLCYLVYKYRFDFARLKYVLLALDCIITGPGAEYGGSRSFSASRRKCKSWNKRYKLGNTKVNIINRVIEIVIVCV